jgi:hypothetical protein
MKTLGQDSVRLMTNRSDNPASRRLACSGCGTAFDCSLTGSCWCAEEPVRLPMSMAASEDCLCRDCLRKLAGQAVTSTVK